MLCRFKSVSLIAASLLFSLIYVLGFARSRTAISAVSNITVQQSNIKQVDKRLSSLEKILAIQQKIKIRSKQTVVLASFSPTEFLSQVDSQQFILINKQNKQKNSNIIKFANLLVQASQYNEQKNYSKAIETAEEALKILPKLSKEELNLFAKESNINISNIEILRKNLEIVVWLQIAEISKNIPNYSKLINANEQALVALRKLTNEEIMILAKMLEIKAEISSPKVLQTVFELSLLLQIAQASDNITDYQKVIDVSQQALKIIQSSNFSDEAMILIARTSGEQQLINSPPKLIKKFFEGELLLALGNAYNLSGEYPKAVTNNQQALAIFRSVKAPEGEVNALLGLAEASKSLASSEAEYQKSLSYAQEALAIARRIKNEGLESESLQQIGDIYSDLQNYDRAIKFSSESLSLANKINDPAAKVKALMNLATTYLSLGDYQKFNQYSQQALTTARQIKQVPVFEAVALLFVTVNNFLQGNYQQTIASAQSGLEFSKNINIPYYQKYFQYLNYLFVGIGYGGLNDYQKAISFTQKCLEFTKDLKDRDQEGIVVAVLAGFYQRSGQIQQATTLYRQATSIAQELEYPSFGLMVDVGLARINRDSKNAVTAISYYKQAINSIEQVRKNISGLPTGVQESFLQAIQDADRTRTIDIYRELADLLLSQNRVAEAQQVLDLVKLQEIRQASRGKKITGQPTKLVINKDEQRIIDQYGSLIAFGQKVDDCKKSNCPQLNQLNAQLETLNKQYNETVDTFVAKIRDRKGRDDSFFDPRLLQDAQEIVEAQPGTVLVYPFVLSDKIWLLWMSKGGVVKSVEIPKIGQKELGEKAKRFRQLLDTPNSDVAQVQALGKELYDSLIKPLEGELRENKIQNLVFALDSITRYIPMSALYDGKNYLVENYNVSVVLSAELTDTKARLGVGTQNNSILALGLSNSVGGFGALPNVPKELDGIVKTGAKDNKGVYPGVELLNQNFNRSALRDQTNGRKILHIATHGVFDPKNVLASFLLLGTGEKFTVSDIRNLPNLSDVHLVVLSACETALGDTAQDGVEINTISYYFMSRGAKAVMSSLWAVNDASTSLLMQNFYSNLAKGTVEKSVSKAEALRQAQLALLKGNNAAQGTDDRGLGVEQRQGSGSSRRAVGFAHPYYWAPFVLIGNGL